MGACHFLRDYHVLAVTSRHPRSLTGRQALKKYWQRYFLQITAIAVLLIQQSFQAKLSRYISLSSSGSIRNDRWLQDQSIGARSLALPKAFGGSACQLTKLLREVTVTAKTTIKGNVDDSEIALF